MFLDATPAPPWYRDNIDLSDADQCRRIEAPPGQGPGAIEVKIQRPGKADRGAGL